MGGIKYTPPNQLPEGPISEQAFQKWKTELEMYLGMEDKFALFFPGKALDTWRTGEEAGDERLNDEDLQEARHNDLPHRRNPAREPSLEARNVHLKVFLSLIAKCVSDGHHATVMQHSTSLNGIFDQLRQDYDIQSKGIHFLNLIDLKYDETSTTPVAFYNQYRTVIINNLKKRDTVVRWKNNYQLQADEKISATFDDYILLQVLTLIDSRLPAYIRQAYAHKMDKSHTLMDFKSDIFVNIKQFKKDIEEKEQLTSLRAENVKLSNFVARGRASFQPAFRSGRAGAVRGARYRGTGGSQRGAGPPGRGSPLTGSFLPPYTGKPSTHCDTCYHLYPGRKDIFASHNKGDTSCPSKAFNNCIGMEGSMEEGMESGQQEASAEGYWYPEQEETQEHSLEYRLGQVCQYEQEYFLHPPVTDLPGGHSTSIPHLGSIKPEPFQYLTAYADPKQTIVMHLMLDSGANVSYIRYEVAMKLGFKMLPCSQLSTLGDGEGLLGSMAEIDEILYRNSWSVQLRALVVPKLQADIIAGLTFMKDNEVIQDISRGTISIHDRKYTVMATAPEATMAVQPQADKARAKAKGAHLAHISTGTKFLLPGQSTEVSTQMEDGEVVLVEG